MTDEAWSTIPTALWSEHGQQDGEDMQEHVIEEALPERNGLFQWAVPASLDVPADRLKLRLDFYGQSVTMTTFEEHVDSTKMVSAMDVAHALSRELEISSGLLPKDALWWTNTPEGAVVAVWREPQVTKVALQTEYGKEPQRFTIPLPGLIFLCHQGKPLAPYVFAAKKRPTKVTDPVFRAPTYNIFKDGRVCPGNHRFPTDAADVPDSFVRSFFSPTGDSAGRSKKHPKSLVNLWKHLNGKKRYPSDDLVKHGTVKDLMEMQHGH